MTRQDVLIQACNQCMEELYKYAVPHVSWEQFKKECKEYSKKYKEWDDWKTKNVSHPEWEGISVEVSIGPKPFEFYYLPEEIMKDICNSYIYAYKIDERQNLLDIIDILKKYCEDPIVDKWIEESDGRGYRGYEYIDNLKTELIKIFSSLDTDEQKLAVEIQNKFFEFLDKASTFYKWNADLNSFNCTIYLGASPCSNKETVIENWKRYRNTDIVINDKEIKENYYGEEIDDQ